MQTFRRIPSPPVLVSFFDGPAEDGSLPELVCKDPKNVGGWCVYDMTNGRHRIPIKPGQVVYQEFSKRVAVADREDFLNLFEPVPSETEGPAKDPVKSRGGKDKKPSGSSSTAPARTGKSSSPKDS